MPVIKEQGKWPGDPRVGLFNERQPDGWKRATDAMHLARSRIFLHSIPTRIARSWRWRLPPSARADGAHVGRRQTQDRSFYAYDTANPDFPQFPAASALHIASCITELQG